MTNETFTAIETQEQFDAAIAKRLERERSTVAKQFEGWLSPEEAKKPYEGWLSPEEVATKYAGWLSPEDAAEKDAKIKRYETNSAKMRIAQEEGIPFELYQRLTGETEEELREDARTLGNLLSKGHTAPPLASREHGKPATSAAYADILNHLRGE
jgi:hypothetical protein